MDFRQDIKKIYVRETVKPVRLAHFQPGEYSIGTILISPLLPFRKVMVKQLRQRGFNTDQMNFKSLVALYYNEFVSNKENKKSSFEPINCYDFRNNVAFKLRPSDSFEVDEKNRGNFTSIEDVTNNIIGQFKLAKSKKKVAMFDSYEPSSVLADEELFMANHAEQVETGLEYKALNTKVFRWGDLKGILLTVFIVWLLFYLIED